MGEFEGKNLLVVGGSSGIGLALTKKLVSAGALPTVWSRQASPGLSELGVRHEILDVEQPRRPSTCFPIDPAG